VANELILVVEDNDKNRKLVRDVLTFKGYAIIEAETGEEGVRLAQERHPSLVLMDIRLPGIDGIEALRRLRGERSTREIPIMAMTASVMTLLRTLVPKAVRIAALCNMSSPAVPPAWKEVERAARSLGIEAQLFDVRKTGHLGPAFEGAVKQRADGLVVALDTLTQANRQLIVELAGKHRLPAVYASSEFLGGLVTYGGNYADVYRRAAAFVDKIFKGVTTEVPDPVRARQAEGQARKEAPDEMHSRPLRSVTRPEHDSWCLGWQRSARRADDLGRRHLAGPCVV
jgi:CheY-like chemotaxis protein